MLDTLGVQHDDVPSTISRCLRTWECVRHHYVQPLRSTGSTIKHGSDTYVPTLNVLHPCRCLLYANDPISPLELEEGKTTYLSIPRRHTSRDTCPLPGGEILTLIKTEIVNLSGHDVWERLAAKTP